MKDNLFKRIWNKNFIKANDKIDKFADDIGGLRGYFKWKKLDKNNNIIAESNQHNDITNLSKSTVIRLLAQGLPKYRTQIVDPTKYKISRMRFGNASYKINNYNYGGVKDEDMEFVKKLYYYDNTENVFRPNENDGIGSGNKNNFKAAGGNLNQKIASDSGSLIRKDFYMAEPYKDNIYLNNNYLYPADKFGNINLGGVNIPIDKTSTYFNYLNLYSAEAKLYPPAHDTLKITLTFFNVSTSTSVATEVFSSSEIEKKIYNRSLVGNVFISQTPSSYVLNNQLNLIYDNNLQLWQIKFNLNNNYLSQTAVALGRIRIEYCIGKYNIINSVIPKIGVNNGSSINRFTSDDYYSLVSYVYDSSPTDFVDDYSVIFSSIMNVDQGNGAIGNNLPVIYTEAFLFNEMDDLFSSITYDQFPLDNNNEYNGDASSNSLSRAFIKTFDDAYLFQWTIKALL
jgi:hypothetical protein